MKPMVVDSDASATDVSTCPLGLSRFTMSPFFGSPTTFGPHPSAVVKCTGVNLGIAEVGSPPSGASIIHSIVLPLKLAPGGGAKVIEKCCPVVSLAKYK